MATVARTTPSRTTPATSRAATANRAVTTTTASPPWRLRGYGQPAQGEYPGAAHNVTCSSTTAAGAPTSCVRAPTSSAADRTPVPSPRHRCLAPASGDPLGRPGGAALRPQLDQRDDGQQRARPGMAAGRRRRHPARPLRDHRPRSLRSAGGRALGEAGWLPPRLPRRRSIVTVPKSARCQRVSPGWRQRCEDGEGRRMQGLVLQLTRAASCCCCGCSSGRSCASCATTSTPDRGCHGAPRAGPARSAAAVAPAPQ